MESAKDPGVKGHTVVIAGRSRRRGSHHEGHGGAWKVAFADFTLALMALFLLLWVMNVAPKEELGRATPDSRGDPHFEGGIGLLDVSHTSVDAINTQRELVRRLNRKANELGMSGNLTSAMTAAGIRVTIHDSDQKGMFARRSDILHADFERLLKALAPLIDDVSNSLHIVGHTDATRYQGESVFDNNWSLSSRRALRSRQALLDGGMRETQIAQVSGVGDALPVKPNDPAHGANRRVELLIMTANADSLRKTLLGQTNFSLAP